jgi:RNA polymerase sigma-70 factor (ECF subfamily)
VKKGTLAALFERWKSAQEELLRGCLDRAITFFGRRTHRNDEVEELAQQSVIAVYEGMATVREPKAFDGWFYQILRKKWATQLRHRYQLPAEIVPADDSVPIRDPAPNPEEQAKYAELLQMAMEAIKELTEQQKACILWSMEGLLYHEIGSLLDIEESTVKSHVFNARKKLEKKFGDLPWLPGPDQGIR